MAKTIEQIVHDYYNQVIPVEEIPPEFRGEKLVPGGVQIVDLRWPAYFYCNDERALVVRLGWETDELFGK